MIRGTIYLTISQVVFLITNFLLHIYLGRSLGPELYGIFGVVSALIIINELILMKGIYETISKLVAEREEAADSIKKRMLKVLPIVGLTIGCIYFFFAGSIASLMNDPELAGYIRLFVFILPIVSISAIFHGVLNGLRQFGKQALISIAFHTVRLITVSVLVWSGFSVKGAIIGMIIADLFKLIFTRLLYKPIGTGSEFASKKMFDFAFQLTIIALVTSLLVNIDLLAVKVFLKDNFQTGLYTSAVTIARIPLVFMFPVSLTVLPTVSKAISDGNMIITEKYIKQSLRLLLIFILPLSLIIMATSENCISLFYGSKYLPSSGSLNILIVGAVFFSIKAVMFKVIVAGGRPRYIIFIGLFSLVVDIVLLIILVAKVGLRGAAVASAVTHFVGFILSYSFVARKFLRQVIPLFLIRIVLASFVVYFIALKFSPKGLMLLFFYFILLCIFFFLLVITKEIKLKVVSIKHMFK